MTTSSSPTARLPDTSVPVTTAPNPLMVKTRSTGSRTTPARCRRGGWPASAAKAGRRSSRPCPVSAETGMIGAASRNDPATNSRASAVVSASRSASTRSAFVNAMRPRSMPSSRQISKCSRVCGFTDSFAAITSTTASMPPAPASMLRTNRSWPGTSTNASWTSPMARWANPRSIVMPLACSSFSRSGSIPVSARTSALLP